MPQLSNFCKKFSKINFQRQCDKKNAKHRKLINWFWSTFIGMMVSLLFSFGLLFRLSNTLAFFFSTAWSLKWIKHSNSHTVKWMSGWKKNSNKFSSAFASPCTSLSQSADYTSLRTRRAETADSTKPCHWERSEHWGNQWEVTYSVCPIGAKQTSGGGIGP